MMPRHCYDAALVADAARWEVYSDLGSSLHVMRQLGHWRPFTSASRKLYAEMVEWGVLAHEVMSQQDHQQSRRVGSPVLENSNVSWIARCFRAVSLLWQ